MRPRRHHDCAPAQQFCSQPPSASTATGAARTGAAVLLPAAPRANYHRRHTEAHADITTARRRSTPVHAAHAAARTLPRPEPHSSSSPSACNLPPGCRRHRTPVNAARAPPDAGVARTPRRRLTTARPPPLGRRTRPPVPHAASHATTACDARVASTARIRRDCPTLRPGPPEHTAWLSAAYVHSASRAGWLLWGACNRGWRLYRHKIARKQACTMVPTLLIPKEGAYDDMYYGYAPYGVATVGHDGQLYSSHFPELPVPINVQQATKFDCQAVIQWQK
ncbi:hypothetical protein U9M48_031517 [Paspalum notatum var. saurae]|uniref:Uncharacterized protein n=1 Tax=Paspalum notatum var. saurae TaxID=547442 RepID=A0AAQ3U5Z2_PASNO